MAMRSWRSSNDRLTQDQAGRPTTIEGRTAGRATGWGRSTWRSASAADALLGYAFIAPTVLILGAFTLWPIAQTIGMSLYTWDLLSQQHQFVGLRNYHLLAASSDFRSALQNTAYYVLGVVPAQTVLALLLAVAANQRIRGRTFFRAAFYFPSISSSVAVALLFLWMLQAGGLVDGAVSLLGVTPPRPAWLSNPNGLFALMASTVGWQLPTWAAGPSIALLSIMALNVWTTTGTMMVIFLAGLQDIPPEVGEAAATDGASPRQTFWLVTLPLLRPISSFVVAIGTIGAFQVFDQIWIMTKGQNQTTTLVWLIYGESFGGGFRAGYAAALAVVLFAVIFALTLLQRRLFGRSAVEGGE
ncbi:MAG: sugar ABC transporter permease [Chloroflexi bacterium]|nr:sugar ABC transporter permease [Chloroflexota bacterium]